VGIHTAPAQQFLPRSIAVGHLRLFITRAYTPQCIPLSNCAAALEAPSPALDACANVARLNVALRRGIVAAAAAAAAA
jgi:hypothetical protein